MKIKSVVATTVMLLAGVSLSHAASIRELRTKLRAEFDGNFVGYSSAILLRLSYG